MEEKRTAVYLLVWGSELKPEDGGSYDRPMEEQKSKCAAFLKEKGIDESGVTFYRSRRDLLLDIERDRIARLVVLDLGRLGANPADIEAIQYELEMRKVELLTVEA